ncbi:hypothetical protein WKW79_29665 [Variovorax robiniae]|uniref:Uncharacterized protein n=1 Tax=Variovorax robiniae TaxID=1836199 RepID=A0ABU8XI86_9BURK
MGGLGRQAGPCFAIGYEGLRGQREQALPSRCQWGFADKLGLRGVIEAPEEIEASRAQKEIDFKTIRHIVVVVGNS